MNSNPNRLVSVNRYQHIIDEFLVAIAVDDEHDRAFEAWVAAGRQGEGPAIVDATMDLSNHFIDHGMGVDHVVYLREAAYQIAEEAERQAKENND